ncbi:MAG: hypothetical protein ACK4TR_09010 [Phenylobacterium sp.]|uniref:hypothetical protein n=1 Tax=Phenylobacterium sp. TaxID=1871053 RepID=UPI00391C55BB
MKIKIPVVRTEEIGYEVVTTQRYIYGQSPKLIRNDRFLTARKLALKTVFDHDFETKRRVIASGRLLAYSSAFAVLAPLALIHAAGSMVGSLIDRFAVSVGDLLEGLGIEGTGTIRGTFTALAKEIVS